MKMRRFALRPTTVRPFVSPTGTASPPQPSPVNVAQTTPAPNPDVAESARVPRHPEHAVAPGLHSERLRSRTGPRAAARHSSMRSRTPVSTARVIDFGTFSRQTARAEEITTESMAAGGVHADAIAVYDNPHPVTAPAAAASTTEVAPVGHAKLRRINGNAQWTNSTPPSTEQKTTPVSWSCS